MVPNKENLKQIRYLHKEFAESWAVLRLAEGFGVSTILKGQTHSTTLKVIEPNIHKYTKETEGRNEGIQSLEGVKENFVLVAASLNQQGKWPKYSTSDHGGTRGIDSPGLLHDEKLEELKTRAPSNQNFNNKVVQRGQEFLDSIGNFLYRI
ncbi:PREDICTED: neugrin-like [Chrysochloris asiatica]|uniref:Neugrin n=1 Tax=Chrysochloris asiatica TaxID=185453 RepID=A0A9B0WN87_CHRAS|nr:PREDICTED: neugrin-like [Chrysochloris asiatica]